jgi:eukaryotic-like serine/threonine-protein kinase
MVSSDSLAPSQGLLARDRSGTCIADRYHLREQIGRGGMATVYRGFDASLSREVAVKILHRERASENYRRRMLQEGRAAVRTEHPHLLRVFDVGCHEDTMFLVMELLTGCSLAARLREPPRMHWSDLVTLLVPAVDAFTALHAAGLVHRDIKPVNLFLRRRGAAEEIVVVDYGLAKMSPEMFQQAGLVETEAGTLLGTPAYMAPEYGTGEPVDPRSDVYSFGVTLYEALAGRLPFPPEPGDTWVSMLTRHMYAAVPPLPKDVPSRLAEVVEKALAKLPEDRFQSMPELATALRACLRHAVAPEPLPRPRRDGGRFSCRWCHSG